MMGRTCFLCKVLHKNLLVQSQTRQRVFKNVFFLMFKFKTFLFERWMCFFFLFLVLSGWFPPLVLLCPVGSWFPSLAEMRSEVFVRRTPHSFHFQSLDFLPISCFHPWISSGFSPIPFSFLTKTTFNPSFGPLALPDGKGRVLAATCDPSLINRVGEGKGAMHTPIHYLIRMAHQERWSLSLYLIGGGRTQHSMSHLRMAESQTPVLLHGST